MPRFLVLFLGGTLAFPSVVGAAAPEGREPEEPPTAGTILASESGWVEFLPDAPPAGTTLKLPEGWIRVESVPEDEEPGGGSFGVISAEVLAGAAPVLAQEQVPDGDQRQGRSGAIVDQRLGRPDAGAVDQRQGRSGAAAVDQRRERSAAGVGDEQRPWAQPGQDFTRPETSDVDPYGSDWGLEEGQPGEPSVGPCYAEQEAYTRELFRMAGIDSFDHPLALLQILGETPGLSPWVRFNIFGAPFLGPTNGVSWIDPVRPIAWDEGLRWAAKDLTACVRRELGFDDRLVDPDTGG